MMKKILLSFFCTVIIVSAAHSQNMPAEKDLVLFPLSLSDWSLPPDAPGMADEYIDAVFTGFGRFDVNRIEQSLDAGLVSDFITKIKNIDESDVMKVDGFSLGETVFTGAEFQIFAASDLIIIPSLTYYEYIDVGEDAGWEVELQTLFSVIRGSGSEDTVQFSIETFGIGATRREAAIAAVEAISPQLNFEIRNIEEFQLKSGIIEIMDGGMVIIDLGSETGIEVGDEFSIIKANAGSDDEEAVAEKTGLLVMTNVQRHLSYGLVVYSDQMIYPGDQLSEISRFGADVSVYSRGFIGSEGITEGAAGLKAVFAGGFWDFRPFAGVELPLVDGFLNDLWPGLPMTLYGGGELMWYIGRFQIESSLALGGGGLIPTQDDESFWFTHIGGTASLAVNWMLTDNFRIYAEGGYSYWYSVADSSLTSVSSYGGIFAGLGVTFKL